MTNYSMNYMHCTNKFANITDNGLLYTCGEARHNKLCLEEADDANNSNEAVANQYSPKRVTAMNGFIVDNVACGGCHTLLTAVKGSNLDFSNNDFSIISEENRPISLTELPPLQKVPAMNKTDEITLEDVANSNIKTSTENIPGNGNGETGSIDSLEANVSGSHIVNINELDPDTASTHGIPNIANDEDTKMDIDKEIDNVMQKVDSEIKKGEDKVDSLKQNIAETIHTKVEVVEEVFKKEVEHKSPSFHIGDKQILDIPDKTLEIANSPPPKTPIIQDLLNIPDISQMSPNLSKHSDDGQKSETGQSENETIPCGSDKSSPQMGKTKTQAVMPIVRSEDNIDSHEDPVNCEESDVVVNKMEEKGRFARIFQSIKDKEHSCMGKGKVIEEKVVGKYFSLHSCCFCL